MTKLNVLFSITAFFALAACASEAVEDNTSTQAEDFAARINAAQQQVEESAAAQEPAPQTAASPAIAQPQQEAAQGVYAPGTATDPNSACNANIFGQFLGKKPDGDVRKQIMEVAGDITEVRFIAPGSGYIKPDPTHPRLNIMIAVDGVIRDIRCG